MLKSMLSPFQKLSAALAEQRQQLEEETRRAVEETKKKHWVSLSSPMIANQTSYSHVTSVPTVWKKLVFIVVLIQATAVLTANSSIGLCTCSYVGIAADLRLEVESHREAIVNHLQDQIMISALCLCVVPHQKPV